MRSDGDLRELLRRALVQLQAAQARLDAVERRAREPIAIIGVGCRFPGGAADPRAFLDLLLAGRDLVTEVPAERWAIDDFYDPDPERPGTTYCRHGAFLPDVDRFDPRCFGISPREAAGMDPQQRLLLEVAWEAIERSGRGLASMVGTRTGVYVGLMGHDYTQLATRTPEQIDAHTGAGNSPSVAAGRLSHSFGLAGPSVAVDTACSSSLVAVHLAVRALRSGDADLALAGGVNLALSPIATLIESRSRMLAASGRCRTFDDAADGIVRGEGCALLLLRRLADALDGGDPILAVIRGTAIGHDGRTSGLTVPSGPAQERVVRDALADAGVRPDDVGYVEAHGTGTPLGDPIELEALAAAYPPTGRAHPLRVGSLKTNMGHLEGAAGIAGLLKAALCAAAGELAPHLHLRTPTRRVDWPALGLLVPRARETWPRDQPRIAAVSSFGFSGTNAHVVVEAPPPLPPATRDARPTQLLPLSARSPAALAELATRLADHLSALPDDRFADACHTARLARTDHEHRLALLARTPADAAAALRRFAAGERDHLLHGRRPAAPPALAFAFAGQGAHYPGMARALADAEPVFAAELRRLLALAQPRLARPLLDVLDAPAAGELDETEYTQPALVGLELALTHLLATWGVRPDAVVGYSVGEYAAAVCAGALDPEQGLPLVAARGLGMRDLPERGGMLAVHAPADALAADLARRPRLVISAHNGPRSAVVSGDAAALADLAADLTARGVGHKRLSVSHAFHSPLMDPMLPGFERALAGVALKRPRIAFVSTLVGREVDDALARPAYWLRQIVAPVRFADAVAALRTRRIDHVLEIGPRPTLAPLARPIDDDLPWSQLLDPRDPDALYRTIAALWIRGVPIDWTAYDRARGHRRLELPTHPFARERCWLDGPPPWRPPHRPSPHSPHADAITSPSPSRSPATTTPSSTHSPHATSATPSPHSPHATSATPSPHSPDADVKPPPHSTSPPHATTAAPSPHSPHASTLPDATASPSPPSPSLHSPHASTLPDATASPSPPSLHSSRAAAPSLLLGAALSTPALPPTTTVFAATWTLAAAPWFADHRVHGVVVAPAAAFVALALDAGALILGHPALRLEALTIQQPLALDGRPVDVQTILERRDDGGLRCRVVGRAPDDAAWTDHFECRIAAATDVHAPPSPTGGAPLAPADLYGTFARQGVEHGPAFRVLAELRRGPDWALAVAALDLTAPGAAAIALDACLQAAAALAPADTGDTHLPVGLAAATVHAPLPARPTIHARRSAGATFDITVRDERGRVCLTLEGLAVRRAEAASLRRALAGDARPLLYHRTWLKGHPGTRPLPARWLVLGDRGGVGERLAAALRAAGSACELVRRDDPDPDLRTLLTLHRPDAIAYLAGLDDDPGPDPDPADLARARARGCLGLVHLVQALDGPDPPRLVVFTAGALTLDLAEGPPHLAQAALWGLAQGVAGERPELRCLRIDLPRRRDGDLLAALRHDPGEDQIAVRADGLHLARLARLHPPPPPHAPAIRPDATYVIAGGLGGLGLALAERLAARGARHLVLLGRGAPDPALQPRLDALTAAGVDLRLARLDLADAPALAALFAELRAGPRPVRGVFHAAGQLHDAALTHQTAASLDAAARAKVEGAWNLHRCAPDDLDHFVAFSSVAALLGPPGQANYAAANAALGALAEARRARGLPALTIDWGSFAGAGMAARLAHATRPADHLAADRPARALGLTAMAIADGLDLLERLLAAPALPPTLAAFAVDWPQLGRAFPAAAGQRFFADFLAPAAAPDGAGAVRQRLADAPVRRRRDLLRQLVADEVAAVLGIRGEIGPRERLFDLGVDSLLALEIRARLGRRLGVGLRATLVFDFPTLDALTDHAADELGLPLDEPAAPVPAAAPAEDALAAEVRGYSDDQLTDLIDRELASLLGGSR